MRTISKFGSGTGIASSDTGGVRSRCPGDDRDLVAAVCELAGLAVDVLGDAAERRVVEVGHDRDAHGG